MLGLYPSILQMEGSDILKKQYENYPDKKVPSKDIGKMADFVFKNNMLEFDSKFYKQISETAIGTTFAPLACNGDPPHCACIFMVNVIFKDARYAILV